MREPIFLTAEQILQLHANIIRDEGGEAELNNEALFLSAIAQPQATFDGIYLHENVFMMAAPYFFHISQNQPFSDGNKRVGFLSLYTFLRINGYELTASDDDIYPELMCIAIGNCTKEDLARYIQNKTIFRDDF